MTTDGAVSQRPTPVLGILDTLQRMQVRIAALAMIAMMLVTTADVFLRYVFRSPIRGSYDFVEAMLVVFVFNGLAAGFFSRSNIVIDLVDHLAGRTVRAVLVKISDFVSVGALLLLAWAMIRPAMQAYGYGDTKIELGLPVYILWIVAGLGMAGTIICAVGVLLFRPIDNSRSVHE
jgi:TRAP-type C4-dicarboxylate transport system permease small subunit